LSGCAPVLILALSGPAAGSLEELRSWWTQWLTALCAVYWVTRLWWLARRGQMGADPLAFALKDPGSYAVGAVVVASLIGRG